MYTSKMNIKQDHVNEICLFAIFVKSLFYITRGKYYKRIKIIKIKKVIFEMLANVFVEERYV